MPLYLDEIWLHWSSLEEAKRALELFRGMSAGSFAFPPGVTLRAGPWFSNEEAKVVLILDIADHAQTFGAFGAALAHGVIARRRLSPLVEWGAVEALIGLL